MKIKKQRPIKKIIVISLIVLVVILYGCATSDNANISSGKEATSILDCSIFYRMNLNLENLKLGYEDQRIISNSIDIADSLCYIESVAKDIPINCKAIDDPLFQDKCEGYVKSVKGGLDQDSFGGISLRNFVLNPSIEFCRGKEECIQMVAILKNNYNLCESFSSVGYSDCELSVAIYNNNFSFCNKFEKGSEGHITCLKIFNINQNLKEQIETEESATNLEVGKGIKNCKSDDEEEKVSNCIFRLALEDIKVEYCDNFPKLSNTYQSKKGLCYGLLAVKTDDLGYCTNLDEGYYQNVCRAVYDEYFRDFKISKDEFIQNYLFEE